MPFDINGATIQSTSYGVSITTNSQTGFSIDPNNIPILANRPAFFVECSSTAAYANFTNGGWLTVPFSNIVYNNGGHFSSNRFTAPVTGAYWFEASLFVFKNTATGPTTYTHPTFIVNGSHTQRHAQASAPYRLRSRTQFTGGYVSDNQINEIYYLTAGDYVQLYVYSSSTLQYYQPYGEFSGFLIG